MAFETGLHRTYISSVERGVRNPTGLVVYELAQALKAPAARLLDAPDGKVKGSLVPAEQPIRTSAKGTVDGRFARATTTRRRAGSFLFIIREMSPDDDG